MKSSKFDQSTFIESLPDHSFSQDHPHNTIIFEKGPPLHSCYDIYLRKNQNKPFLNSIYHPQAKNNDKENYHKPVFGCSEPRHEIPS